MSPPPVNWAAHIAEPFGANDLSISYMAQFTPAPVATLATSGRRGASVSSGNATWDLFCGPSRQLGLGPNTSNASPSWTGGRDSAGLGGHPITFVCYHEAGLTHARWAITFGLHPSDAFGPLGMADVPHTFAELKDKEIKGSGLAAFSRFGSFEQAIVAGQGPVGSWAPHPFAVHDSTLSYMAHSTPAPAAMLISVGGRWAAWYGPDRHARPVLMMRAAEAYRPGPPVHGQEGLDSLHPDPKCLTPEWLRSSTSHLTPDWLASSS